LSLNPQVNTSSALTSPSQSGEPASSPPSSPTGDDCAGREDEHGKDGAVATQSIPLLSHRNSVSISSRQSSVDTLKRSRDFKNAEEMSEFPAGPSKNIVVRTSQSGLIPDTPGPLPEISGLIPDTSEIDPTFQTLLAQPQNRTSKSGLLAQAQNPPSRSSLFDDLPPLTKSQVHGQVPEALSEAVAELGADSEAMN